MEPVGCSAQLPTVSDADSCAVHLLAAAVPCRFLPSERTTSPFYQHASTGLMHLLHLM
jgi:hypothetical protein